MNRRKFLSTVGTGSVASFAVGQSVVDTASAASREWINSFSYGTTGNYDSVNIEIYKPTFVDSEYRYWSRLAAQDVFGQATDDGYISGYEITEWNIDWSADCDGDILTQWDDYRTNQGWTAAGSHQLVVNCGGSVAGKAGAGDAWQTDRSCYAKTYGNDKNKLPFKHNAAHEMLHNHVSSLACDKVQSLEGPDNDDHSLGDVVSRNGQDLETPLAEKSTWDHGSCPYYGSTYDGQTMEMSYCEKKALEYSAEHWDGQH